MIAVISDIHGNLQALEAVLRDIKRRGIIEVLCLGDIVGYGANPNECIDRVRERGMPCVRGNHDEGVVNYDYNDFNNHALIAMEWTRDVVDRKAKRFLGSLPYVLELDSCVMAHANLVEPQLFSYTDEEEDPYFVVSNLEELGERRESLLLIGHTHKPAILGGENGKAIVNVGSVGQPRDDDRRACYVILDGTKTEIIRVEYDFQEAARRIAKAGFPEHLSKRLYSGV